MKNPFRGLRFSLLDFHAARATAGAKLAMLGIALIPLIYGALYLMGFYDPYGHLDAIPVVVVNEDKPAYTSGGELVAAGDDLVRELKESESLDYYFVESDELAQEGLEDGTYYSKIVIPEDFSADIASADSDEPHQARLVLETNDANNYLSSILSASVMRVVTSKTNYSVAQNYLVNIFDSIDESGDSIKVAADGAAELADGVSSAQSGSATITNKLGDARGGAKQLDAGIGQLADGLAQGEQGSEQLATGLDQLHEGSSSLESGLSDAASGSKSLASGLDELKAGSAQLTGGVDSALAGAQRLQGGIQSAKAGADQVASGLNNLYAIVSNMKAEEIDSNTLSALSQQLAVLAGGADTLDKGLAQLSDGSADLVNGLTTLQSGAQSLDAGIGSADAGANTLAAGISNAYAGSKQITSNLATASSGAQELAGGTKRLAEGAASARVGSASLASGLGQLRDGSATLTNGLASAKSGSATLANGLGQLQDGSATLTDGLATAQDGSRELADGLAEGMQTIEQSTRDSDAKAQMMSEPVALDEQNYTYVENYGTGFAPYFIALGLWVGALVMTFLFEPLNKRLVSSGASPAVAAFAGLVPWIILGTIQSLAIGATIQFACGIDVLHTAAYYPLIVLTSIAFCAMIQSLVALFGFPGKFVAVVLLMLQLTTAAGTFPIETEFPIFQAMSPYLPMTYAVHALRIAMRGVNLTLVGHDVVMLLTFTAISFVVTCMVARRKRLVTMMDLHPLVDL